MRLVYSILLFVVLIGYGSCNQCQCVPPMVPKSSTPMSNCANYDERLMADSIDDAINSFPDLTMAESERQSSKDSGCVTKECKKCQKELRHRLREIGLIATSALDDTEVADSNVTCTRYSFTRNKKAAPRDDSSSSSSSDEEDDSRQRIKRQVVQPADANSTDIGTRYTISCTTKGVTTDSTGTVSLCNSCWVWRKLPDNYRPQFVNELMCDTSDESCLSGYAQCSIGHRTFDAVRSVGGVNTTVTLTAGSYCECRVKTGSTLQNLVSGTGAPISTISNTVT